MELASCYPSGAENFEVASKFLENLCCPGISHYVYVITKCQRKCLDLKSMKQRIEDSKLLTLF
jgi:hypothetical protein